MIIKTTDQKKRLVITTGFIYLAILLAAVIYGAIAFHDLYTPPVEAERTSLPATSLINEGYGRFLTSSGLALALYLAIWAGLFGVWRRSYGQGLLALAVGTIATIVALAVLPWVYFPFDRYPAPAAWVFATGVPLIIVWIFATVFGRLWIGRGVANTAS